MSTYDIRALAEALSTERGPRSSEHTATVLRRDNDGTLWVRVAGGADESPVNGTAWAEAAPGDTVLVRIEGGRLSLLGNVTTPAVGGTYVRETVEPVAETADEAIERAGRAQLAAEQAEADAARAHEAADQAQGSADEAAHAATLAEARAQVAEGAANDALASAAAANAAATKAIEDAAAAKESADAAADDAADAKASAARANTHASDALAQLSVVQDVAGTLDWIASHGTYVATTDTSVREGVVYFELVGGEYVPVAEPEGDPSAHDWYVLDVTDSQTDYIMSHLAVTSAGLWVLPSGMGQSATPQAAPGYKMLLASDGAYLYDGSGHLVTTYGESIRLDSSRPQYIGGEDAYIAFYDSDDDGRPDSIAIAGNVTFADVPTITQMLADVEEAKQAAEDVPIVTLSSTNGTVFKRNRGVSTTVVATIFTPGGRISTRQELTARFGAGAYLEWGWRDVVTDADHVLVSTDPRIINDGFALVVSPADVDSQAVITCSLNY